jgi:hypothetical protein
MTDHHDPIKKGLHDLSVEPVEHSHHIRTMAAVRMKLERESPVNNLLRNGAMAGGLAIAAVVAMILIPATYNVNVGTLVKAEFTLPEGVLPHEVAEATTRLVSGRKMLMVDNGVATLTFASKLTNSADIQADLENTIRAKFPAITELNVSSEPIIEKHGGNALAAVTGGRIEIGCEGMSDAEIEGAIVQALTAHGLNVQQVTVETTSPVEGQVERRIEIRAECDSSECADLPELELNIGGEIGSDQQRVIVRETR